jgi:hypothetical protein
MMRQVMMLTVGLLVFTVALVVVAVAFLSNRRAAETEAATDIPGMELAPPESMEVHRLRTSRVGGVQSVRVYATTLDEAAVDQFYADALDGLGYSKTGERRVHEPSGQVILGEYTRGDVQYTVSVVRPPHFISGKRITEDWSLVIYVTIDS